MINVLLNETGEYANIDTIMPLFPGLPAPVTSTAMKTWDMDHWDDKAFEELPAWVQEKIKKSSQYQKEHVKQTDVAVQPSAPVPQTAAGAVSPEMLALMQQQMMQQSVAPSVNSTGVGGVPF